MVVVRLFLIALILGTVAVSPAAAQRIQRGYPCGPKSTDILGGNNNAWVVGRVGTADSRIVTFTVIAAYPEGRFENRALKSFIGQPCRFDLSSPGHVAVAGDARRFLSKKMKPEIEALVAAINANDAVAAVHLETLKSAYERADLNILESSLYHVLAAPVLRASGEYEAGLVSAETASILRAVLGADLAAKMEYEIILLYLSRGQTVEAVRRFSALQERKEHVPLPAAVALMEKVRNGPPGNVYTFRNMNFNAAMVDALQP